MKQLDSNKYRDYACVTCSEEIFPFYDCGYNDIISDSFNSNFDCKCLDDQQLQPTINDLNKDT